ncbi:MAG TPA: phosphoribosylamine--glycine ligase [Acidimicrobiales bacterium]|nr:phosphoribosylamine--glycine ligase [Acidimicrobiales bacterium]
MSLRVAVVGSGGREHALRHVLSRTATVVSPDDDADLYVVGPEAPLVDGLADRLRAEGKLVFGSGADGARLEGSKGWMKEVLAAADVPTARFAAVDSAADAAAFLRTLPGPYVVKTDYLAAGKGVLVTDDLDEALADATAKLAQGHVVIEEGMAGPELSVLAVCNGKDFVLLPPARDHKRVGDGDTGPNTGGMGAFSPVPDAECLDVSDIVRATLDELLRRGIDYRGVLYAGLMLTSDGPKVLEYNVRFGDPEAQVVLPRFTSDLAELLLAAAAGDPLPQPTFADDAAVTVVLAAEGYPGTVRRGDPITGIEAAESVPGVTVFRAAVDEQGRTAGGRVLAVTALAPTLAEARSRAYEGVAHISWPGMHYRKDICAQWL